MTYQGFQELIEAGRVSACMLVHLQPCVWVIDVVSPRGVAGRLSFSDCEPLQYEIWPDALEQLRALGWGGRVEIPRPGEPWLVIPRSSDDAAAHEAALRAYDDRDGCDCDLFQPDLELGDELTALVRALDLIERCSSWTRRERLLAVSMLDRASSTVEAALWQGHPS